MITKPRKTPLVVQKHNRLGAAELKQLRNKINNTDYLHDAIQRIALILSNELLNNDPRKVFNG